MYEYQAKLVKVKDGDTAVFMIDLGMSVWKKAIVRFLGINAPETRGKTKKDGLKSKRFVQWKLRRAKQIVIKTHKTGKYGRWLGEISIYICTKRFKYRGEKLKSYDWVFLNDMMVERGYAIHKKY